MNRNSLVVFLLIALASCTDDPVRCVESNLVKVRTAVNLKNRTIYYTDDGKLSSYVDSLRSGVETTTFSYDGFGRLSLIVQNPVGAPEWKSRIYYNASNRIMANRHVYGVNPLFGDSLVYTYNDGGRLSGMLFYGNTGSPIITYEYSYPFTDSVRIVVRQGSKLDVSATVTFAVDNKPKPYPSEYYYCPDQGRDYLLESNRTFYKIKQDGNTLNTNIKYEVEYNADGYLTEDGMDNHYQYSCKGQLQ